VEIPVTLEQDKHKLWTHTDCLSGAQFEYCAVTLHKDYAMNMHAHSFYEVNIVIHGKGRHFIKNNYIDVEEKCMFVIPPYMEHGYYNGKDRPLPVRYTDITTVYPEFFFTSGNVG